MACHGLANGSISVFLYRVRQPELNLLFVKIYFLLSSNLCAADPFYFYLLFLLSPPSISVRTHTHLDSGLLHQPPINRNECLLATQLHSTFCRLFNPLFHHRDRGLQFALGICGCQLIFRLPRRSQEVRYICRGEQCAVTNV